MNVEEKILRYLHSKFPRPIVFGFSGISIEKFGLNPDTDPLEFDRTFDLLKEQCYIILVCQILKQIIILIQSYFRFLRL